jgi:hypothetical protein
MNTFLRTKSRYDAILPQALRKTGERLPETLALLGIEVDARLWLTVIDAAALDARDAQWSAFPPNNPGNFDWRHDVGLRRKDAAPFHVAVWHGETLCGLGLGRKRGSRVDLDLIRFCVDEAALTFARDAGAKILRLVDPLPGALPLYEAMGFRVVRNRARDLYCEREV